MSNPDFNKNRMLANCAHGHRVTFLATKVGSLLLRLTEQNKWLYFHGTLFEHVCLEFILT